MGVSESMIVNNRVNREVHVSMSQCMLACMHVGVYLGGNLSESDGNRNGVS